ncbi:MAG: nucleotide sugar dehydrogenase [Thermodesulfobacteriota bacterium]
MSEGVPTSLGNLKHRIEAREARIAVIGLGYVGLPLAVEIASAGFPVLGVDLDKSRAEALSRGANYISDVDDQLLGRLVARGRLKATDSYEQIHQADAVIICVPTPLTKHKEPDISHIVASAEEVARRLHPGMLVILESTTYPGTTEELILPMMARSGLRVGHDFSLAFSPERLDPGNPHWRISNTPKIMGGVTARCTELATIFYRTFIQEVIPVSSPKAAEMIKLLENTFRAVNIALVNEVAIMCDRLGIDTWEVIEGAATKPFGFTPVYPGPGLGGHCIPIDPHYLSWKLKSLNYHARFIELAGEINSAMPRFVLGKIADALNDHGKALRGSRILVFGVSYKKDVSDVRESPALEIIQALWDKGAEVSYHDPYVQGLVVNGVTLESVPMTLKIIKEAQCVVILTDHSCIDYEWVVRESALVVDTRNATRGIVSPKIRRL